MKRYYFAAWSPYGVKAEYGDHNQPILYMFDTKEERDQYVEYQQYNQLKNAILSGCEDGIIYTKAITRKEAKRAIKYAYCAYKIEFTPGTPLPFGMRKNRIIEPD